MSNVSQFRRVPSYRRHKPSGQAVVTLGGDDFYLGKYNTAASRAEYHRLIAEWATNGSVARGRPQDLTVAGLLVRFLRHAKQHYRRPDGTLTSEIYNFKLCMRPLNELYGETSAADFGPLALKAVRQKMIERDWSRKVVNAGVNRIRHIFKWGVENELVPANVIHGLKAVAGLRYGRSAARETAPVKPVPDAFVDAVLPFVSRQVAAMIELQRITGMRSGEVTSMRGSDINTQGTVWVYSPTTHKTAWHGHDRKVYLGPKAQRIVRPFLKTDLEAYLFSPADAEAERHERRFGIIGTDRRTPVYPSELRSRERRRAARQKRRKPKRQNRERFGTDIYWQAVHYGIEAANRARLAGAKDKGVPADQVELIPRWFPHQLRHNAATNLRREHGIEVARIILGHRSAAITEVYAEVDHARAVDVMARVG